MFSKLAFSFLLAASLTCFGQVTTLGGYATTSGPAIVTTPVGAANGPLISTPDIALPGSGPAVGVPLSNTNTNDSRAATGPSIANPNVIVPAEVNANGTGASEPVSPEAEQPAGTEPFEFGIQQFGFAPASASSYGLSLGEIAKKYRNGHQRAVRTFTNDNIARLSAVAFQPGALSTATRNQVASSTSATQPGPGGNLIAENRPPALPQSDRYSETAPVSQSPYQATAAQQRHAVAYQTVADQSAAPNVAEASTAATLPQTASHLPLFLLIGGLGVAGGTLSLLRK